ncbi:MAG: hypothetical protein Devi2KO_04200 [Devosia indica]
MATASEIQASHYRQQAATFRRGAKDLEVMLARTGFRSWPIRNLLDQALESARAFEALADKFEGTA